MQMFFSLNAAPQSIKGAGGTQIAYNNNRSSKAVVEADSIMTRSGILRTYPEGADSYVIEIFVIQGQSISSVTVYNMLGKEMKRMSASEGIVISSKSEGKTYSFRINSSRFNAGMYIIAVEGTEFKDVERFVKSR